jgi:MFS family permease
LNRAIADGATPKKGVLSTIFFTVLMDLIGFSIIFPLFPAMLEHYLAHEQPGGVFYNLVDFLRSLDGESGGYYLPVLFGGVLGTLYSALQFVFAPIWGRLSDRIGRRPVLLLTLTGVAASYVLWFFAGSFTLLILARFLGGIMAGNISVATAAIADVTTRENRARGMALIGIGFGIGFTFGPALGGALSLVHLNEHFPSLTAYGVQPFSAAAAGAFLLSLLNLVWVYRKFDETLASGPDAASKTSTARYRTIDPRKLFGPQGIPGVHRAHLIYFVFFLAFSGMEFTLVFLAAERFGYTPTDNAWMFVFVGLVMAFVQGGIVRRMGPKTREKNLALAGVILTIPGFVVTGLCEGSGGLYLGLGLLAAGGALVTPSLSSLVSLLTPADRQGEILGIFRSLGALARAIGPIIACVVYWRYGSGTPYVAGAILLLLPLFLVLGLPRPEKKTEPVAAESSPAP